MEHSHTYRVISHGIKGDESNSEIVIEQLAKTFNLKPDRARVYLDNKELIVKKNISLNQAQKYKNRLERIGINVELLVEPKDYQANKQTLSLQPVTNTAHSNLQIESGKMELSKESGIWCHDCDLHQERGNFCISCGSPLSAPDFSLNNQVAENCESNNSNGAYERSIFLSIIICLISGMLGAFTYHFILSELITQQGFIWGALKGGISGLLAGLVLDKTGPHKISITYLFIAALIICFNGNWFLAIIFSQL